jgi:hypothetical protein
MSQVIFSKEDRRISWPGLVTLIIASVMAIGSMATFAIPYLALDPEVLGRFEGRRAWILAHVGFGAIALILGPIQIWFGLKRRRLQLHRYLGVAYLTSVALGSIPAFYLAATNQIHWIFGLGLGGLAVAWVTSTGLGFAAIRKRMISQHQEWMVRSYVTTFAFVTFRFFVGFLQVTGVGTLVEQLNAASWFCWAVPLLITEAIIQGRKVLRSPASKSLAG